MAPESDDTFNYNYNLLYSVYSFPNTVSGARAWAPVRLQGRRRGCGAAHAVKKVLPFFGGYLSDKLGVRRMAIVFAALIAFGQVCVRRVFTRAPFGAG